MRACTRRLAPGQAWLGGRLGGVALLFVLVFLPPSLRRSISTSLGALWARCRPCGRAVQSAELGAALSAAERS